MVQEHIAAGGTVFRSRCVGELQLKDKPGLQKFKSDLQMLKP